MALTACSWVKRRADLVAVADGRDALTVLAVAEGAAREEQLTPLSHLLGVAGLVLRLRRGEHRVESAGHHQPEQQHEEARERTPTAPGEATSGLVEQTHDESLCLL